MFLLPPLRHCIFQSLSTCGYCYIGTNDQQEKLSRGKEKDRDLSYSDFGANEGRRATDGRERDLTTTSLFTRLLRNRGQESVTAASCHLRNSNRIVDM